MIQIFVQNLETKVFVGNAQCNIVSSDRFEKGHFCKRLWEGASPSGIMRYSFYFISHDWCLHNNQSYVRFSDCLKIKHIQPLKYQQHPFLITFCTNYWRHKQLWEEHCVCPPERIFKISNIQGHQRQFEQYNLSNYTHNVCSFSVYVCVCVFVWKWEWERIIIMWEITQTEKKNTEQEWMCGFKRFNGNTSLPIWLKAIV